MAVLDQECLTCRGRACPLKPLLPQQSTMGVLWQMQRAWREERSEHTYISPDTQFTNQNNDFSFQYNLTYQSWVFEQALLDVDNLDKRRAFPDGWTRVCHRGEMEGCSQTSQREEEGAALFP